MKSNQSANNIADERLRARLEDGVSRCLSRHEGQFLGFLNERERALTEAWLRARQDVRSLFWGGYPEAERVFLGLFPAYWEPRPEDVPLSALTVRFRSQDALGHRDVLGALLSHGIQREVVGDILVEPGRAVCFVRQEMADYLLVQLTRIGRVGVRVERGAKEPLPPGSQWEECSAVVSSLRLDCLVAACTGLSRTKAAALIQEGLVTLDHEAAGQPCRLVESGSKLSIRGRGRFLLDRVGAATKTGRLRIFIKKYGSF